MYHWVTDKDFLKRAYSESANIVNQFVQKLKSYDIEAKMNVVGSKSRNMVTQNEKEPIDFDFNVLILSAPNMNDCREIKAKAIQAFNEVLRANDWGDCQDSTSALTTKQRQLSKGNKTAFSVDVCLVRIRGNMWERLIHRKTGYTYLDQYCWEDGRVSLGIAEKELALKKEPSAWKKVRETYLTKKNMYLTRNDRNHPSFVCYIEAVNEVYYQLSGPKYINRL